MLSKTLALLALALCTFAQNPNSASYPAGIASDTVLLVASNRAATTLNGSLNNSTTTINVASTSLFTVPTVVTIDSEIIHVCSKTLTTFTVCASGRGFNGTTGGSHNANSTVTQNATSYFHNQLAIEIQALETYAVNSQSVYLDPTWIGTLAGSKITGSVPEADQFTFNPADCGAHQFATTIAINGDLGCAALTDNDIPDTITASNYLLLTGGTLSGQLITSNLGIEFTESDTNPTCSSGNYTIYADLSEAKFKKCTNGVASDLDTTGSSGSSPGGSALSLQYQADATTFGGVTLNVSTTRKFVMQSGDGMTANAPSLVTLVSGDIPNNAADTSGTAAHATALATTRAIYGNNFDGTAALAQIIASTYGGTGNGFTKFSGPTTSEKTFTVPNADAVLLYSGGALGTPSGGTATNITGLPEGGLSLTDITTNNVTSTKHGFTPKSPGDATQFLNGAATNAYAQVKDSDLSTTDITTNNVSTSKHGFMPKLPNDATKYIDGTGAYSVPVGSGAITTNQSYRTIGGAFDGGGSAITVSSVVYVTVPYACTISAWTILVDTGTISFDVWRLATGTAIPTVTNTLMTGGYLSISTGTAVRSTTLSRFTSTTVTADDIFAIQVQAVASATKASLTMRCAAS